MASRHWMFLGGLSLVGLVTISRIAMGAGNEPIVIGMVEPYSGEEAAYGQWADNAWTLAMQDYGDKIQGHPIKLVRADSKCEPSVAVSAARQVLAQDPAALMAPVCSGDTIAILPLIKAKQLPTMSANIAPKITQESGGWVWRVQFTSSVISPPLAEYMIAQGHKRIGVIHDTSGPGVVQTGDLTDVLKAAGVPPVAVSTYEVSDTDYSGPLLKLKAANPDALFVQANEIQGGRLLTQIRQLGFNVPIYGTFSMFDDTFIKAAGEAGNGLIGVTTYLPDWSPIAKQFDARWFDKFHYHTNTDVAALYEIAVAMITALNSAPEARGSALNDIIGRTHLPNMPMGTLYFDKSGNNANPIVLLVTWDNQQLKILKVLKGQQ